MAKVKQAQKVVVVVVIVGVVVAATVKTCTLKYVQMSGLFRTRAMFPVYHKCVALHLALPQR